METIKVLFMNGFKDISFFIKTLKTKKKKLALTLFYCPSQEIRLGDSGKLICTDQSRFSNFSHAEDFRSVKDNFKTF